MSLDSSSIKTQVEHLKGLHTRVRLLGLGTNIILSWKDLSGTDPQNFLFPNRRWRKKDLFTTLTCVVILINFQDEKGYSPFGRNTFVRQTFGQQSFNWKIFSQKTFGQQSFGWKTLANRHFASKYLANRHFAKRILANIHLANIHLTDRHFADSYLADRHFADRYLADRHLDNKYLANRQLADKFCQQTLGQQAFVQETFVHTFGWQTFGRKTFGWKTLNSKTFGQQTICQHSKINFCQQFTVVLAPAKLYLRNVCRPNVRVPLSRPNSSRQKWFSTKRRGAKIWQFRCVRFFNFISLPKCQNYKTFFCLTDWQNKLECLSTVSF